MTALELRLLAAFVLGLVTVILITPFAIRIANRLRLWDRPHGYKAHKAPTPYLGGAAVMVGLLAGGFALGAELGRFAPVLAGALVLGAVGVVDDWRTVRPVPRLVVEGLAATLLWATGFGWSVAGSETLNLVLTIAWVIGLVNAFNLMDNIDGATSTVAAVSSGGAAALAVIAGETEVAVLALALCGACAGFLRFNLAGPARIFLGDGGSMPIGFVVAATLMAVSAGGATTWEILVPATFIAGLPIVDTGLVIVSRHRRGVAIFEGARDHTTHRLQLRLRSCRRVAAALAATQGLLCIAGVLVFDTGPESAVASGMLFAAGWAAAVLVLENPEWLTERLQARRERSADLDPKTSATSLLLAATATSESERSRQGR